MHNHHLQCCKEFYLWTGGISTPERAQKVTTDCQSACGHLWHADAILQRTRLISLVINPLISNLLLWDLLFVSMQQHKAVKKLVSLNLLTLSKFGIKSYSCEMHLVRNGFIKILLS